MGTKVKLGRLAIWIIKYWRRRWVEGNEEKEKNKSCEERLVIEKSQKQKG